MLRSIFLLIGLIFTLPIHAQQIDHVQGEVIVQFHSKVENISSILTRYQTYRGRKANITTKRCLSQTMNIWQIKFDFSVIHERQLLATLRKDRLVENVQFNHLITPRNRPNDPDFLLQWEYLNSQNMDADLDAELAWEITTGGVTVNGDTIVIAALDDGVDLNHEDFGDNLWRNLGEIPNNGIDDDNNGFIDDVEGWNALTNTGDISGGGAHGTSVMGVMGAKGNNNIGVAGINWDVKLMMIRMDFMTDEATLIAGYDYPWALRKLYNKTNGAQGAFVVATNSSWGIDNGFAEDAPIWCALYDSLGTVGILNCGATSNAHINVDMDGDLPTTCPSDYLIGVTNVKRNGVLDFSAGFGKENIDIGGFGDNIYSLARNNRYALESGTSLATPQVAGAIGLLYSAPCNNFGDLTRVDPAAAALLVRQYILEGVQANESLDTTTSSGGQLNLNNSLQLLINDCGPCPPPLSVDASNIIDVSAQINWIPSREETTASIRYKIVGAADWITLNGVAAPYELNNLTACTDYEYQVKSDCGNETSGYSRSYLFKTDGCCIPPENIRVTQVSIDRIRIEWGALFAAKSYEINFRESGVNNPQLITTQNNFIEFTDLTICTNYEFQVRTICENLTTDFSNLQTISTTGCGSCTDVAYCETKGEFDDEWIANVQLNTLMNESALDDGYGDFTGLSTELNTLESYDITIKIGYDGFPFNENIQVWIDFNQDGEFDVETETVIDLDEDVLNEYTGTITIPADAKPGLTRMRIAIKWRGGADPSKPKPCGTFDFGEVEDYCVNITRTALPCFVPDGIALLDSPINDIAILEWNAATGALTYNYRYRIQTTTDWIEKDTDDPSAIFLTGLEKCRTYEFQTQSLCDSMLVSEFSPSFIFQSSCECAPPTSIQQVDTLPNRLNLVWEENAMADEYEVNLNKVGETNITKLIVAENEATVTNLEECAVYEVSIRSLCLDTNGVFSQAVELMTSCDVALTSVPTDVENLTVYPNPFIHQLQVAIDLKTTTNLTLHLYDVSGKLIMSKAYGQISASKTTIDLMTNDLFRGIYLLGIETDNGRLIRRVAKL